MLAALPAACSVYTAAAYAHRLSVSHLYTAGAVPIFASSGPANCPTGDATCSLCVSPVPP